MQISDIHRAAVLRELNEDDLGYLLRSSTMPRVLAARERCGLTPARSAQRSSPPEQISPKRHRQP
jgi:hypothetical protein